MKLGVIKLKAKPLCSKAKATSVGPESTHKSLQELHMSLSTPPTTWSLLVVLVRARNLDNYTNITLVPYPNFQLTVWDLRPWRWKGGAWQSSNSTKRNGGSQEPVSCAVQPLCASQVDFKSTVVGVWNEGQRRESLPIHYRLWADGVISSLQPLFAYMNAT